MLRSSPLGHSMRLVPTVDNAQEMESFLHFYGTLLRVPTQNSCSWWPPTRVDNHDQVGGHGSL